LIARVTTTRAGKPYASMALTMRSNPVPRPAPDTRHRLDVAGPDGKTDVASRRNLNSAGASPLHPDILTGLVVVDDLPQRIAVSQRELDVIETYLGDLLDEALGRSE
jgi:hypothetical protein